MSLHSSETKGIKNGVFFAKILFAQQSILTTALFQSVVFYKSKYVFCSLKKA